MMARFWIRAGARTHPGLQRGENHDAHGSYEPGDPSILARTGRLYVVCDGMGGMAGAV
jgi:serine/threonine protein phosphatase PrpC